MIHGECRECGRCTWLNKNYTCIKCEGEIIMFTDPHPRPEFPWGKMFIFGFLLLVTYFLFSCTIQNRERTEYNTYVTKMEPGKVFVFDKRFATIEEKTVDTAKYSVLPVNCIGIDFYVYTKNDTIVKIENGYFSY